MNQLRFEFSTRNKPHLEFTEWTLYNSLDIFVDGQPFMQMVKDYELTIPTVNRELAGTFSYPDLKYISRTYLTGSNDGQRKYPLHPDDGKRIALLECECCIPGCAPLLAEVSLSINSVMWHNFGLSHFSYADFGPFTFDRRQYEREFDRVDEAITRLKDTFKSPRRKRKNGS